MTAISRRSHISPISAPATLATADDLDGTTDNTQAFDITGAKRYIVIQTDNGTNGTAGIDCIEISHDAGKSWNTDSTLMLTSADDATGTIVVAGVLNVAGTEPTNKQMTWKGGPQEGPTAIRCGRKTTDTGGTTWVTGAPTVQVIAIGLTAGALTALA
jgi:hypothetical protein